MTKDKDVPLNGINIIITGPISSIGLGLSQNLYKLGSKIIAVSISPSKSAKLKEERVESNIDADTNDYAIQILILIVAYFADLDYVASSASDIVNKFQNNEF